MIKKLKLYIKGPLLDAIKKISPKLFIFIRYSILTSFLKVINFIKYGDKYFFNSIAIEISSYCNRKCNYCPNKDYPTPENFMDEITFKTIIKQLKDIKYKGLIYYHLYNEPLFDNRLEYFVEYVKENIPEASSVLFTNGDILTLERALKLNSLGIDEFIITVHGDNPEKNIERLKILSEHLGNKVVLQTSKDLYLSNRGGLVDTTNNKNNKNKELNKCVNILASVVDINGNVLLCCQDYHRKYIMGNILEEDIKTIWQKEKFRKIRNELLSKNIVKLPICKICLERDE